MTGGNKGLWSRRAAAAVMSLLILLVGGAGQVAVAQPATVRLVVDYGDGVIKTIAGLPWKKGETVLDVMNDAKGHPHGITFSYSGSGSSAFLTGIDNVNNQGGGPGKKNWQFWVNTSYADRGFGSYTVQALDVIFWRFTTAQRKGSP